MEANFEKRYQEYLKVKSRARGLGMPMSILLRFKERSFRHHLITLHGNGSPLSDLTQYLGAMYGIEIQPQQLRKILQRSDKEAWDAAVMDYRQYRAVKQQERAILALGH